MNLASDQNIVCFKKKKKNRDPIREILLRLTGKYSNLGVQQHHKQVLQSY
jgi:hypothetical protein